MQNTVRREEEMSIHDDKDLTGIENASQVAKHIREVLKENAGTGVTTRCLDELCRSELRALGAESAPMLFYGAPAYAFYSVNNTVVHGLPSDIPLKNGDILKIDITPLYEGFISDTACSIVIGGKDENPIAQSMIDNSIHSFKLALQKCRNRMRINEIGRAIERNTEAGGFFVVRELSGHGVGRAVHEEPSILNYYEQRETRRLTEGLVIAIEPMIVNRKSSIREKSDGWTIQTKSGTLTAHYEHTVLITDAEPIVLTA